MGPNQGAARSCGCGTTHGKRASPFLDYDVQIRTVICSTNAIESLNARYRRAAKARGHFPTEQAALKMSLPGHPSHWTPPPRSRTGTMDSALEASPQRVRHHLRRPLAGSRNLLVKTAENTHNETVPVAGKRCREFVGSVCIVRQRVAPSSLMSSATKPPACGSTRMLTGLSDARASASNLSDTSLSSALNEACQHS